MITARLPNETALQHHRRNYTIASREVERNHVMALDRYRSGYFGAAKFYQFQAARWFTRQVECERAWRLVHMILHGDNIPYTSVAWSDIFRMANIPVDRWQVVYDALAD